MNNLLRESSKKLYRLVKLDGLRCLTTSSFITGGKIYPKNELPTMAQSNF